MSKKLKGVSASLGISIGKCLVLNREEFIVTKRKVSLDDIPKEILRFEDALINTRREILSLQKNIEEKLGTKHAQIFDAHLLVLEDRVLVEDVITRIKKEKVNVEYAFNQVIKKHIDTFMNMKDEYLRERVFDIKDVAKRVLSRLFKEEMPSLEGLKDKVIIVAHDLSPADTASLHHKNILGFVTDIGGPTSHTAIIARSSGIPAVVGVETATQAVSSGDTLIIDGYAGVVIVNPSEETKRDYLERQREEIKRKRYLAALKKVPSETKDKRKVSIAGNVEFPGEIGNVIEWGAEGIGLYRTEYMFLGRDNFPSEEEQYKTYFSSAKRVHPFPVIIRTLDLGGDKFLTRPDIPPDLHPFLGWRAIRFCLARPDIFKTQLRAILRASRLGNVKIMFPMISGVDEIKKAKEILEETKQELREKGELFDETIELGIMIEVPSAALTSDILAKEVNFFSIGTNDLIQYSLAVDRGNEKVAYLYEPLHPAVLKLINLVVKNAHKNDIWIGMCGEMASSPMFAFLLLGLGLDEFSVSFPMVPRIKRLIRAVDFSRAKEFARYALSLSSASEISKGLEKILKAELKNKFEEIVTAGL